MPGGTVPVSGGQGVGFSATRCLAQRYPQTAAPQERRPASLRRVDSPASRYVRSWPSSSRRGPRRVPASRSGDPPVKSAANPLRVGPTSPEPSWAVCARDRVNAPQNGASPPSATSSSRPSEPGRSGPTLPAIPRRAPCRPGRRPAGVLGQPLERRQGAVGEDPQQVDRPLPVLPIQHPDLARAVTHGPQRSGTPGPCAANQLTDNPPGRSQRLECRGASGPTTLTGRSCWHRCRPRRREPPSYY